MSGRLGDDTQQDANGICREMASGDFLISSSSWYSALCGHELDVHNIIYLMYLSDTTRIREYNWGVVVLAYNYYRLGEGCMWKAWIPQHIPDIIGWGEVPTYTEFMLRASAFSPLRGNQVSDPYRRGLDRMAVEDVRYDCYADHRETVPFDEITLYSRWLAASSTIIVRYLLECVMRQFGYTQTIPHDPTVSALIAMTRRKLDEFFPNWEHHMVPEEAQAVLITDSKKSSWIKKKGKERRRSFRSEIATAEAVTIRITDRSSKNHRQEQQELQLDVINTSSDQPAPAAASNLHGHIRRRFHTQTLQPLPSESPVLHVTTTANHRPISRLFVKTTSIFDTAVS
ncbi:uncharacterized protein LOC131604718 [Vicia villosa]|uniref:uncharacterized protein LOC131604718 n=1 Tax=Vicia villosa TaxID=3911 RepID=UPI00273BDDB7|nr:uncharacterized protein LOC131604718 [Vicia villosa]